MTVKMMPPWLDAIRYLRCRCYCRAKGAASFEGFIGPKIRGALGRVLKRSKGCDPIGNRDCEICPSDRKTACSYDRLLAHDSNHVRGLVLSTDPLFDRGSTEVRRGDYVRFDLVMIGHDMSLASEILRVIKSFGLMMGDRKKADFELVEYGCVDPAGHFSPSTDFESMQSGVQTLKNIVLESTGSVNSKRIEMVLRTPAEITLTHKKYLKKPEDFSFKVFVMRAGDRMREIAVSLCGFEDREGTMDEIRSYFIALSEQNVRLVEHHAQWRKVHTHPNRKTGGMVGSFVYEGELTPFLPLLDVAAVLGIGKNTSNGFGQLSYRIG